MQPTDVVILIPGYTGGKPRGFTLTTYVQPAFETKSTKTESIDSIAGCPGIGFITRSGQNIRVYEIPWEADVSYLSAGKNPLQKLWAGCILIFYWFFSPVWRAIPESRYMAGSLLTGGVILLLWVAILANSIIPDLFDIPKIYISVKATTFKFILLPFEGLDFIWQKFVNFTDGWLTEKGRSIFQFSGISVLAFITLLDDRVNVSDLFKRYLSRDIDERNRHIDDVLRDTIIESTDAIMKSAKFNKVKILGHSFGAMLAIDAFASGQLAVYGPIELVTIGGFFRVLMLKSQRVSTLLKECLGKLGNGLPLWTEFWSPRDFASAKTPLPSGFTSPCIVQRKVLNSTTWIEALNPHTHFSYFNDPTVLNVLI